MCVIARSTIKDKELFRTLVWRLNQLCGYDPVARASEMNDQQCLPGAPAEPATHSEGSGVRSPSRTAGAPKRVRHSPSTPIIGGYSSRRWWSLSSTNVWCSAADHSDVDHVNGGTLIVRVTFTVNMVTSTKRCKIESLPLQTTKRYMA